MAIRAVVLCFASVVVAGCGGSARRESPGSEPTGSEVATDDLSPQTLSEGQSTFRFETFGDEEFWTDTARMHEVVEKSVSPATALKVGLKVDADAIPADVAAAIKSGKVDLESPATTVTLLKLNAVVGLKGTVENVGGKDRLVRLDVVDHYDRVLELRMSDAQKRDLVEYLKSL